MLTKQLLFHLTLIFHSLTALGQGDFAFAYGGDAYDAASSFVMTNDGGYLLLGDTYSFSNGTNDIYLIKIDEAGNLLWEQTFGDDSSDSGYKIISTMDDGFMIAGYSVENGNSKYFRKISADGDSIWEKGYPKGVVQDIIELEDGSYIFAGAGSFSPLGSQLMVGKLSSDGNLIWEKNFGGLGDDYGRGLVRAADGGFVIGGETRSGAAGPADVYVVKVDENGNLEWEKKIGGNDWDFANDITATTDGGFILAGIQDNSGIERNAYLLKIDATGETEWENHYGGASFEEAEKVIQNSDGGYTFIGNTYSFGGQDLYLVKTSADGTLIWENNYGGASSENGYDLMELSNGDYALIGSTLSFGAGGYDAYFLKVNENGEVLITSTSSEQSKQNIVNIFPNPAHSVLSLEINERVTLPVQLKIVTLTGETVFYQNLDNHYVTIDAGLLPKGGLIYTLFDANQYLKGGKVFIK